MSEPPWRTPATSFSVIVVPALQAPPAYLKLNGVTLVNAVSFTVPSMVTPEIFGPSRTGWIFAVTVELRTSTFISEPACSDTDLSAPTCTTACPVMVTPGGLTATSAVMSAPRPASSSCIATVADKKSPPMLTPTVPEGVKCSLSAAVSLCTASVTEPDGVTPDGRNFCSAATSSVALAASASPVLVTVMPDGKTPASGPDAKLALLHGSDVAPPSFDATNVPVMTLFVRPASSTAMVPSTLSFPLSS